MFFIGFFLSKNDCLLFMELNHNNLYIDSKNKLDI